MARTVLTRTRAPGNVSAGSLLLMQAADDVNLNAARMDGGEIVMAYNGHATLAQTVTITGASDEQGRKLDITAHSIPIGEIHLFGPLQVIGWQQAALGYLHLQASSPDVKFGVIASPVETAGPYEA